MHLDDVTPAQARKIGEAITPSLTYLGRLHERMRRRGFAAGDPLMVHVNFALEAMRQLRAALHAIEASPASSSLRGTEQIVPCVDPVPQWRRAMGSDGR